MLKNAYLLAKIGAYTAENEQHVAEILPKIGNYPTDPLPEVDAAAAPLGGWAPPPPAGAAPPRASKRQAHVNCEGRPKPR